MPIYDKPVRLLIREMVDALCSSSAQTFTRQQAIDWLAKNYLKIKEGTVTAHLIRFSTNAPSRFHYSAKPGTEDLLFQIDGNRYRRFEKTDDPAPLSKPGQTIPNGVSGQIEVADDDNEQTSRRFAYEADLRDFLAKNPNLIEPGLRFDSDEDRVTGIEFPAGSRFIDILALDKANNYVVIELKVSRGYDRAIGQLLRYIAWIEKNHATPSQSVRGVIIAREISEDLQLACSKVLGVSLFEYEISVTLKPVNAR
jgi:endonuclease